MLMLKLDFFHSDQMIDQSNGQRLRWIQMHDSKSNKCHLTQHHQITQNDPKWSNTFSRADKYWRWQKDSCLFTCKGCQQLLRSNQEFHHLPGTSYTGYSQPNKNVMYQNLENQWGNFGQCESQHWNIFLLGQKHRFSNLKLCQWVNQRHGISKD